MSENDKEGNIEGTINAVSGLAKAIPIYDDVAQPAAKEIGKALETVAKTVNIALAPVKGLVWGYEQLEGFVNTKVSEKLQNTPEEDVVSPKPNVAGPALEALRYTGHEESLRDLYANLLASSMDKNTTSFTHPGFVEMIKQITPDEAKLLKLFSNKSRAFPILSLKANLVKGEGGSTIMTNFSTLGEEAGCENFVLTSTYLDNLSRLGLIEIPSLFRYTTPNTYTELENHPVVTTIKKKIDEDPERTFAFEHKGMRVTELGKQFINICVIDYAPKKLNSSSKCNT